MCGIVGYWGPQNPKDVIINGLKKLEYRGYDSAGVAILHRGEFKRVRAEGKLKNLEEKLQSEPFDGHLGIGHTRWATHGVPSERNAHPHSVKGVSLVHNGIIENYQEIKAQLLKKGAVISSDTDSELVAHLLAEEIEQTHDLLKAVQKIIGKLRGAFSIVAVWDQQPDCLVAFKDGPPLVVGLGDKQNFIVSDVQAALAYTQRFVFLDDREIVSIHGDNVKYFDHAGKELNKKPVELHWSPQQVEKRGFSHFMLKEIFEQPQAFASAITPHIDRDKFTVKLHRIGFGSQPQELDLLDVQKDFINTEKRLASIDRIIIVACGTSYYAGLYAKYLIEAQARVPVEVEIASEFRYRHPVISKQTLVMTISQSGETADTLAALRMCKAQGLLTLSLCNVKNSSIDREASGHLYMNCGPEIGVASTKAFVSSLAVMNVLALAVAKAKGVLQSDTELKAVQELVGVPAQMEIVLAYDKYFSQAAETLKKFKGFLYMGRGPSFPIALEGALKLKELAYMHAEGYAAGEMKHGPLALIDDKMAIIMIAPSDELFEKTLSNLEEAKARGGVIIAIGSGENERLKSLSSRYLALPMAGSNISPILTVVPLQLMAFHLAKSLGYDVDQPRNLAKSVTVE